MSGDFYRLKREERNMFSIETITLENGKIVKVDADEPTYLPIAFDKLRKKTGQEYFKAIQENS